MWFGRWCVVFFFLYFLFMFHCVTNAHNILTFLSRWSNAAWTQKRTKKKRQMQTMSICVVVWMKVENFAAEEPINRTVSVCVKLKSFNFFNLQFHWLACSEFMMYVWVFVCVVAKSKKGSHWEMRVSARSFWLTFYFVIVWWNACNS